VGEYGILWAGSSNENVTAADELRYKQDVTRLSRILKAGWRAALSG
jgi:hypothetical protein